MIACLNEHKDSGSIINLISFFDKNAVIEKDDDRYSCEIDEAGLTLVFNEEGFLRTIFLHSENDENTNEYQYDLPHSLKFKLKRGEVHKLIGKPSESGGGHTFLNNYIKRWDNFHFEGYKLNIRYDDIRNEIIRVAISTV